MPGYTRQRTEQIHAAARQLVAAVGGVEVLDAMTDLEARRSVLVGLAKQLATNEVITYKTARLHIAKACRRMRTPTHTAPKWGGQREGAGRKKMPTFEIRHMENHDVAVVTYPDGSMFTTSDWQGRQPQTAAEIPDWNWVRVDPRNPGNERKWRDAIILDGYPRILA